MGSCFPKTITNASSSLCSKTSNNVQIEQYTHKITSVKYKEFEERKDTVQQGQNLEEEKGREKYCNYIVILYTLKIIKIKTTYLPIS